MSTLVVHVVPRARRTEVSGWHGDAIKVKVAEGGAADALARAPLGRDSQGDQA